ncbi:protein PHLOEM PROTEIN 2-LIKE A1-like [Coffea eugenioides]|uniref:protein PHLOEM PROTEIN 2-LIKE A1-like n=1 Tax=Coffea eugenioides TaxID=49369 RepID=UPI000F6114B2|nr:protein PHLOEM PROTEIN 2-LIKE A1-like [Coffea eugenioides]
MERFGHSSDVILDPRRKKKWFDKKKRACYVIYPRSMLIGWGESEDYWSWEYFQGTSGDYFEIAKLKQACWFEIEGRLNTSELSPKVHYEAVFVIKLSQWAHGWDTPLRLKLTLPGGKVQERRVPLLEEPRGEWIEIRIGNFQIEKNESSGDIVGNLQNTSGYWKQGLALKGFIIRPVT